MAVIKNKKTRMWEVRTYYKDLTGEREQKTKRGFAKKSEALEWERNFKLKENQSISMSFQSFMHIYFQRCRRIWQHNWKQKGRRWSMSEKNRDPTIFSYIRKIVFRFINR